MSHDDGRNHNESEIKEPTLKETITEELERLGTGGAWVWTLFFLCVTPNILNGFHVSSYVFLGHLPTDVWCGISEFDGKENWTIGQIRNISADGLNSHGCTIWNWNYTELSAMSFDEARAYTQSAEKPDEISCMKGKGSFLQYDEPDTSIVPEWDLVCENTVWRTSAQVMVSVGKFVGASTFGILSDKYGRRFSFTIAAGLYIISSLITTASPWYILFLLGRMGLGSSASGLFYPAFALLTENIGVKHRSWMSIAFSASYPVGMLFLAFAAYLVHPWRYLQLTLTVPGFILVIICYFMIESPRWLLMKNREAEAYKIVFKKKTDIELTHQFVEINEKDEEQQKMSFCTKFKSSLKELGALYGSAKIRRMALTCYFMWCVTSLCYYVTALNADNLAANRYLYVAITGCVDIPSYILPMILLKFMGRRTAACALFMLAGVSLLVVLAVPQDNTKWLVFFAMFGRFGVSAVYSIITLHTAELFPTEIRNSALGTCSTMAHVGSIAAPYIVDILGVLGWYIPTTICGCTVIAAGLLILTLPETSKRELSDHVKEEVGNRNNSTK